MLRFRITYRKPTELRTDVTQQFARGGVLLKVPPTEAMQLHTRAELCVVLPDGTEIRSEGEILNVMDGYGVAISVSPATVDSIRQRVAWQIDEATDAPLATHEEVLDDEPPPAAPEPEPIPEERAVPTAAPKRNLGDPVNIDELTQAEQIHMALHGSRDERTAILRHRNRGLHTFVLKNPQITLEDVTAMAKNAQMAPDLLKQISERKEWFQRPAVALSLARNPRTPPDVAMRALEYVPQEALRQIAKGVGALPHVVAAARKRVIGPK